MSILIRGMEMPVMCSYCNFIEPFIDYAYCHLAEMDMKYEKSGNCRHPNCPLVEIPTPHGRLIDADKLKNRLIKDIDSPQVNGIYTNILHWISIQETVIEGSEA